MTLAHNHHRTLLIITTANLLIFPRLVFLPADSQFRCFTRFETYQCQILFKKSPTMSVVCGSSCILTYYISIGTTKSINKVKASVFSVLVEYRWSFMTIFFYLGTLRGNKVGFLDVQGTMSTVATLFANITPDTFFRMKQKKMPNMA